MDGKSCSCSSPAGSCFLAGPRAIKPVSASFTMGGDKKRASWAPHRSVVFRSFVESDQQCPRLRRNDRGFIVLAGKLPDLIQRLPKGQRDELDFSLKVATQEVGSVITFHAMNAGENLCGQQLVISVGVLRFCVAVPDAGNHSQGLGFFSPRAFA